jgi:hypothetical protein
LVKAVATGNDVLHLHKAWGGHALLLLHVLLGKLKGLKLCLGGVIGRSCRSVGSTLDSI